jgi:hypothetical protein
VALALNHTHALARKGLRGRCNRRHQTIRVCRGFTAIYQVVNHGYDYLPNGYPPNQG